MVPVAQETTANTVRLPYSFSRRFSLVAWCEASLEILHVHPLSLSVLQELQRGLNAPFTLRQIDEAEFEQRLNAVWQRDSSEARQLMEDLGSAEDFFIRSNGIEKVLAGETSLDEVLRVTMEA